MKLIHALATIERGAMGNHALALNTEFSNAGIRTETYAETIREEFRDFIYPFSELSRALSKSTTVLYQLGNESPVADLLYETPCRLVVNYHNITPAEYFERWNPPVASSIGRARAQLARLAEVATAAVAVSEFNARELRQLGYSNVVVIPPLFNGDLVDILDKKVVDQNNKVIELLFVGRIAPHKRQDFLIRVCDFLNNEFKIPTKLTFVGRTDAPSYLAALKDLVKQRNLQEKVEIIDDASTAQLADFYNRADVFVCASEHEGFCIPIVESLHASLPVVARDYGAIRETLGGAGVLVEQDDPIIFAACVADVIENTKRNEIFISRSNEVLKHFDQKKISSLYIDFISRYLD